MIKLIKSDFKRVLKDRLFLVVCILAGAFALITPLLYAAIFGTTEELLGGDTAALEALGLGMDGKTVFFSAFSLGNNLGLIVPVLLAIILCKDFSYGTVRNKIISGCSRRNIFASMYTVCATVMFGIICLHGLLSLGISLIFFPYSSAGFSGSQVGYFFASLGIELLVFLFVSALLSFLCVWAKNAGLAVVLYAAVMFCATLVASILQVGILALAFDPEKEALLKLLEFIQNINVFGYGSTVGLGDSYSVKQALYFTLAPLLGAVGFFALGTLVFSRKDIK